VRLAARRTGEPRARRLREALETLGPIYVKFGQVLSTRRDLVPLDIADELAKLQDRVPPFPSDLAIAEIEKGLGRKSKPCSPRSSATRGKRVDRPGAPRYAARRPRSRRQGAAARRVEEEIARTSRSLHRSGVRGAPVARRPAAQAARVVAEFARHLEDELNLMREAANASQLRRNFERRRC